LSRKEAMMLAVASMDVMGVVFGDPEYAWERGHAD
jgi:hypothetical protein